MQYKSFDELFRKETEKKLNANNEYTKLLMDYSKAVELYEDAYERQGFLMKKTLTDIDIDVIYFDEKRYPAEKARLEKAIKKTLFGKKKLKAELATLENNHQANKLQIEKIEKYEAFIKEVGVYDHKSLLKKMEEIQEKAVREVLIENYDNKLVQEEVDSSILFRGMTVNINLTSEAEYGNKAREIINLDIIKNLQNGKDGALAGERNALKDRLNSLTEDKEEDLQEEHEM